MLKDSEYPCATKSVFTEAKLIPNEKNYDITVTVVIDYAGKGVIWCKKAKYVTFWGTNLSGLLFCHSGEFLIWRLTPRIYGRISGFEADLPDFSKLAQSLLYLTK